MSGLRRSARSRRHDDHGHPDPYASQAQEVTQGMMGMGMGIGLANMGMGYHHPPASDMGYYNPTPMGYQYHHNVAYPNYQHPQQQQHLHGHSYHHGHGHDPSQTSQEDSHSGRTLRARNTVVNTPTPSTSHQARGRRAVASSSASSSSHSHQVPPTPGANLQDSAGEEEDEETRDDTTGEGPSSGKLGKKGMETSLTIDQMVQSCLYYLLLMQHKKVPVKRSDLVKNAMNSQHKQFPEVIKKLQSVLKDVFGMILVKLDKGTSTTSTGAKAPAQLEEGAGEEGAGGSGDKKGKGKGTSTENYILISKFPSSVCDSVMKRDPEADSKKTVLYLVLTTIFMLNRAVDEEVIWKIINEMQLDQMVCEKKSDLRKFLKSEFVSSGYLNMELSSHNPALAKFSPRPNEPSGSTGDKPAEHDDVVAAKYSWGPRAHMEYSKYNMLKFVTQRFPGRRPYEFTVQYSMLSKKEKAQAEKDLGEGQASDADNEHAAATGESGSAIQIKQKKGGKGETYTIDGENTETETEET